jgi:hypothetical protein
MEIGESVKGKDLVLKDRDLLVMESTEYVHIVCDGRLCRPGSNEGNPDRGEQYWTKVGSSNRFEDFEVDVGILKGKTCKKCIKMLKRNGIVLRKGR